MKKTNKFRMVFLPLLVLLLGLMLATSCSDSDDDSSIESYLSGSTWNVSDQYRTLDGEVTKSTYAGQVVFQSDGTGVAANDERSESFKWSLSGSTFVTVYEGDRYHWTYSKIDQDSFLLIDPETFTSKGVECHSVELFERVK